MAKQKYPREQILEEIKEGKDSKYISEKYGMERSAVNTLIRKVHGRKFKTVSKYE